MEPSARFGLLTEESNAQRSLYLLHAASAATTVGLITFSGVTMSLRAFTPQDARGQRTCNHNHTDADVVAVLQ
jgi:hypothetical protein